MRKQFGPSSGEEVPVLEYQLQVNILLCIAEPLSAVFFITQQYRLLPYLAAAYVQSHFSVNFFSDFIDFLVAGLMGDKSDRQVSMIQSIQ